MTTSARVRDIFESAIADQNFGILVIRVGKDRYRMRIGRDKVEILDRCARKSVRIPDVLVFERIANEGDMVMAQKEARTKQKPIEQLLAELGLLEESLVPVVHERMVLEEFIGLLEEGESAELEPDDPQAEATLRVGLDELLSYLSRVESITADLRAYGSLNDIVSLTVPIQQVLDSQKLDGFTHTVAKLIDGKRSIASILAASSLPRHYLLQTINGFFKAKLLAKLAFRDLMLRAGESERKGNLEEAYGYYKAAYSLQSLDTEALEKLAQLAEVIEDRSGIIEFNTLLAHNQVAARNESGAVKCFERVARIDTHNREAYEYLFRHATRHNLSGELLRIGRELVRIYGEHKEFGEAAQVAERCLKEAPDDMRILEALAKTEAAAGNNGAAIAAYDRVREHHERKGDHQEAMNILLTMRRIDPQNPDVVRRIEAIHSAERRRLRARMIVLAVVPLVIILGLTAWGLYAKAAARRQARDDLIARYEQAKKSEDLDKLGQILLALEAHNQRFPDQTDIVDMRRELNLRIDEIESRASRALRSESTESEALLAESAKVEAEGEAALDRALELVRRARAAAPAEATDLLRRLAGAEERLAAAIQTRDEAVINQARDDFDGALAAGKLVVASEQLGILERFAPTYDLARSTLRDRKERFVAAQGVLIKQALSDVSQLMLDGRVEEAERRVAELEKVASEGESARIVREKLVEVRTKLAEANLLLSDSQAAIATRDYDMARSLVRRLVSSFPLSEAAAKAVVPVQVSATVDVVDIEDAETKLEAVHLPRVFEIGIGQRRVIRISTSGYTPATLELVGDPENAELFAVMKRAPLWTHTLDGSLARTPAARDGRIAVPTARSSLLILDAEGKPVAAEPFALGGITGFAGDVVLVGGVAVFATTSNEIIAVTLATGAQAWRTPVDKPCRGSPAVSPDGGTIYFGGDDGSIYAVAAAGGQIQRRGKIGGPVSSGLIAAGGRVYVGGEDDALHALEAATLAESWNYPMGSDIVSRPLAVDGGLIVAARALALARVGLDGKEVWRISVPAVVAGEMATNGELVFAACASPEGQILGLRLADGKRMSGHKAPGRTSGGVALIGNRLAFGDETGLVTVLSTVSELGLVWSLELGGKITTAPAALGDLLFVGTSASTIIAFREE